MKPTKSTKPLKLLCVSLFVIFHFSFFSSSASAQIPFTFNHRYYVCPEKTVPLTVVLHGPDGQADTLYSGVLRSSSKSIRRQSNDNYVSRHFDRTIAAAGDYHITFTLDSNTLDLPFTLQGDELLVEADLFSGVYSIESPVEGHPSVNIYRPAPKGVKLYYLGADTLHRKVLFHLVNHSPDTLHFHDLPYSTRSAFDRLSDEIYTFTFGSYFHKYNSELESPLPSGRSLKLDVDASVTFGPGRHRAAICISADNQCRYLSSSTVRYCGDVVHSSPWYHPSVCTVHVVFTDPFFLTTIDLRK